MNEKRDKKRLKEVGQQIRFVREQIQKMSLDDVSSACDVTKGNLSMIENGNKDFAFTTFLEIAKGMGVHPKRLIDKNFDFLNED